MRVRVITLGEYAITIRAWVWGKTAADGFVLACDLYESIKKRFDAAGLEIPVPYRKVILVKEE